MEQELRDVLKDIKESSSNGLSRLEGKIDAVSGGLHSHALESAVKHTEVFGMAKAANRRVDEHLDEHRITSGRRWELWLAIIVAGLSGLGTLILMLKQLFKSV